MNPESSGPLTRREFVTRAAGLGAISLAGLRHGATAAGPPAAGATAGAHPVLTPAADFYDVSRGDPKPFTLVGDALREARLTPETWRLEITGDPGLDPPAVKVAAQLAMPLTLAGDSALDLPALLKLGETHGVKFIKAMQCLNISEPLGQGLWEGVPLREVLRLCGTLDNVRRIYYRGFHNREPGQIFQSSLSYTQAMETAPGDLPVILAFRLNGAPIPLERGGPVRMLVPWAHGFKSIKWLQQIILTNDHRANDTYALQNNDPESTLKTAAYVDGGPGEIGAGQPASIRGRVISGLSGLARVEVLVRKIEDGRGHLADDAPELVRGTWQPARILPPPDWGSILPAGVAPQEILGFDPQDGRPLAWPLRYGMASWVATLADLPVGRHEIYARAVDRNGFAQPEPRPTRKSGKNMIQSHTVEVKA